jgi:hypothetical protein
LTRIAHVDRRGRRLPQFTASAANTYVLAFCTSFDSNALTGSASLSASGVVPSSVAVGTELNIALNEGGTWVDAGSATVGASGAFTSSIPTSTLPNINHAGSYLVYEPPAGSNTVPVNLGFALIADDGRGLTIDGLQFYQVEDPSGVALPTPTTTYFPIAGSSDLDGLSLTPDASEGAVVDGADSVYFFSGIPQHTFTLSPTTVDLANFANGVADADSIVSLPGGDEAVVTADSGYAMPVISGILSGNPVIADTIPNLSANGRDGLVISADGKVMLSRGNNEGTPGLDVYSVTPVAAHTGSTHAGTTSFRFTLVKSFRSGFAGDIVEPYGDDGRDGMAISPADSSRGVVIGEDQHGTPTVQLLTGLESSSPTSASLPLHLPHVARRPVPAGYQRPEPSPHRRPLALTLTSTPLFGVSITPDGTTAYVSTDEGIVTVGGVNTGTLAQAGPIYAPAITGAAGASCPIYGSGEPYSLGVLPDGKYLVVDYQCAQDRGTTFATQGGGILLTIPILAGGVLGAPVGQLNQVIAPLDDQILVH